MSIYGCYNKPRPTSGASLAVQDGYVAEIFEYESGHSDRIDRIVTVPYVMTVECQYTRMHADDKLCAGCIHRSQP